MTNDSNAATQALATLQTMLPENLVIGLHEPQFDHQEKSLTDDCLTTGWVSTAGKYVDEFEQQLCAYTDSNHAIATVNGTSALHLCLILAGVNATHEVLAPALTFVGTINPIAYQQATPHFIDCNKQSLSVDSDKLERYLSNIAEVKNNQCVNRNTGRVIKALVVVHILGVIGDIEALAKLAKRWHLVLIEDAAEALGSRKNSQHAGTWADFSALSFNGNKIITTGGGGAVLCKKESDAKKAKHLSTTAKQSHQWAFQHDIVGFNYRMPNINAAIGCAQLKKLPDYLTKKKQLSNEYARRLSPIEGLNYYHPPADTQSNHWLNLIQLNSQTDRDSLLNQANNQGILLRPFWNLMQQLPMFNECPKDNLSASQKLWETGVCLPSSPALINQIK